VDSQLIIQDSWAKIRIFTPFSIQIYNNNRNISFYGLFDFPSNKFLKILCGIPKKENTVEQMNLFESKEKYQIKTHNKKIQRTQKAAPLI
jgi:hypothetical protein